MIRLITLSIVAMFFMANKAQADPFTIRWYGPDRHFSIVVSDVPHQIRYPQYTYPGFTWPQYIPNRFVTPPQSKFDSHNINPRYRRHNIRCR